ncbi:uncharacterized protein IUM83_10814 [Phytophthora cinnamomi]|uniref:uncharacterized protein n=1 Tax=Phytophthora cinnamomi TaxID=4785 RepID=UPI003559EF4E|nr:hypothetical protein IUM83_10814 [Phytophthora cinnamomi]
MATTQATALNEVAATNLGTNDRKGERRLQIGEYRGEGVFARRTAKQTIALGLLCAVVALEALYLFGLVVAYITDWFIVLLAVTERLKRLRSQP